MSDHTAHRFRLTAHAPWRKMLPRLTWLPAGSEVLEIVAILLVVGWLLGLMAGYTGNGAIHYLILLAIAVVTLRLSNQGSGS